MGTCNGLFSICALGGYAMESRYVSVCPAFPTGTPLMHVFYPLDSCHFGNIIEYDTVTNLSWSVNVRTHTIAQLIDKVLAQPWPEAEEQGREVPPLKRQDDCVVI
jgi:lipase ATG15